MEGLTGRLVEQAVASRPHTGETVSGDAWWVEESRDTVRVAVVDGLGHGPEAATASKCAITLLREGAREELLVLLKRCHAGLSDTRGVVLSLAHLDAAAGTVTWAGVGNVTCILARPREKDCVRVEALMPARGVLGRRIPPLIARTLSLAAGDVLILATDGVKADFQDDLPALDPLQRAADEILRRFGAGADDALVMLLRYRGAPARLP